jgi:hypothetical protein
MKYVVISRRVGTPGEEYKPKPNEKIQYLLDGGFISTVKETKSTTVKTKKKPKEK